MSQSKLVVSLDGYRVYANAVGDPANPALFFVHGFSADSSIFNSIFDNTDNTREFFLVSRLPRVSLSMLASALRYGTILVGPGGQANPAQLKAIHRTSSHKTLLP